VGAENNRPETVGTEAGPMEGTKEMGYWEFKKEICNDKGWQLRRVDPQSYTVINSKRERIGIFGSSEGYFPDSEGSNDAGKPTQ